MKLAAALILISFIAFIPPAAAGLVEETIQVAVKVEDAYGKVAQRDITVTLFHDEGTPAPRPLLVLNHGRAPDAAERAAMGRARYMANARWFAGLGFLVAVPTRVGYGVSGGDDVEDSGDCGRKNYAPGYLAAAQQTLAVIEAVRRRADAAADRGVGLGQSYGGATAITLASLNPPGIQAAINFAGGGGGNPKTRPGDPCSPAALERLFGSYGKTSRLPTLWIYTENDLFLGARQPKAWFEAFRAAGGDGEFIQFPPHGDDGHGLFTRAPDTWRPAVLAFLRARGFAAARPEATAASGTTPN